MRGAGEGVSIIRKTAPTGIPLRVVKPHRVPMWKTDYLTRTGDGALVDLLERMVEPTETLWLAEETVVSRGGDDYVLVLSPRGVGWMYEGHLVELDCF